MSVTIRLFLTGKKNQRSARIVAATTRSKRQGKPLEILGHYSPLSKPPIIKINKERLEYWLDKGAILSKAVRKLTDKSNF